jgi:hypothetical protein
VSLFGRLFAHPGLRDVREPTRLKVRGKLASPSAVRSPLTPVHAVLLRYQLVRRRSTPSDLGNGSSLLASQDLVDDEVVYTSPLLSEEAILVETEDGIVSVPTASLEVRFARGSRHAEPLLGALRPDLAAQVARVAGDGAGEICYREQFLLTDDPVELEACIRPGASHGGPYRGGTAAYVVCEPLPRLVELPAPSP